MGVCDLMRTWLRLWKRLTVSPPRIIHLISPAFDFSLNGCRRCRWWDFLKRLFISGRRLRPCAMQYPKPGTKWECGVGDSMERATSLSPNARRNCWGERTWLNVHG